jgi:purine-binding chemotaxis protein CheW
MTDKSKSELVENAKTQLCVAYRGYKDGSVEFFGDQVSDLTGYDRADFNSRRLVWSDLILDEYQEQVKATFRNALRTNKIYQRAYQIRTKTATRQPWIQEWGQIVCDENGNVEFVLGVLLDITEDKLIEQKRIKREALTGDYLILTLDSDEYGIDITHVIQVLDVVPMTFIPGVPNYVKGVINLRDIAVPVVDLRMKLGMIHAAQTDASSIDIAESNEETVRKSVGLLVDSVSRVLHIDGEDVMAPPRLLAHLNVDFILGIAGVENTLKILLDIDKMLVYLDIDDDGQTRSLPPS